MTDVLDSLIIGKLRRILSENPQNELNRPLKHFIGPKVAEYFNCIELPNQSRVASDKLSHAHHSEKQTWMCLSQSLIVVNGP